MEDILAKVYDPEAFREAGHRLVNTLADHLDKSMCGESERTIQWQEPEAALERWQFDPNTPEPDAVDMLESVLAASIHLHNPRYMGHQISPPAPIGALAGLLSDFMNNGMAVYEMGIAGTAIETNVIRALAQQIGFDAQADGFLTSGGTLANLTAMIAARSIKSEGNVWQEGSTRPMALMVSEEAHYCVDRTARIMGWGEAGIIKVPVNARFQMRTELLEEYYQAAIAKGLDVIAVVGSACSTSTGSFDDLEAIAAFCGKHDLWFHVDGAHGGASVFSQKYQHLVKGISKADSVVMDFHKMLITPSITTALVFKNGAHSYQTFNQKAQYLFAQATEPEWFNLARRTFECTKLMMSIKVYAIWRTYGTALFDTFVTRMYDLGAAFAELIRQHPDFELAVAPECNIVCFRYLGGDAQNQDRVNARIRQAIVEEGHYYIVQTQLRSQTWLRVTLVNANTDLMILRTLLEKIEQLGKA